MELKKQVTSLEISKKLKELGVKQESLFYWSIPHPENASTKDEENTLKACDVTLQYRNHEYGNVFEAVSAFTVAELGEMLPWEMLDLEGRGYFIDFSSRFGSEWWSNLQNPHWQKHNLFNHVEKADTEADARGAMLIYLLENKLI